MPTATIEDVRRARRVLVYGVTGSGKSTLAIRLGERLGLPVHLVDDEIGWLPGWVERPVTEQRALAQSAASGPAWVFDSAYGTWRELVLARADVVVALDLPRWLSLGRLLRRSVLRVLDRRPICHGNTETLGQLLGRNSIIRWHFRSFSRKRRRMRAWAAAETGVPVYVARRPRDVRHLLVGVE